MSAPRSGEAGRRPEGDVSQGDPQVGFRFRIVHEDERIEVMLVDADRALVGSAAHCEVRLPPEIAAHEHLEVYLADRVVRWGTRKIALASEPVVLDGVPAVEGTWAAGSTLSIGPVRMTVETVPLGPPKAKPPIWAIVLAIPILAVTIAAVALAHGPGRGELVIPPAPQLLPPTEEATCRLVAVDQRAGLAQETLRVALSKRESSPFAPADGVAAVSLFERAAACFRNAQMQTEAKQAMDDAHALRGKLDDEYRVHRVRVEHAFRIHDAAVAKRELGVLIPMTSHLRGPYTDWLAQLDRAATLELADRGRL